MKALLLLCIRIYQALLSPLQALFPCCGCRLYPTCSEYLMQVISRQGIMKGVWKGLWRVLKCNPWSL